MSKLTVSPDSSQSLQRENIWLVRDETGYPVGLIANNPRPVIPAPFIVLLDEEGDKRYSFDTKEEAVAFVEGS